MGCYETQTIKLDATKRPAQIDMKHDDGPIEGETIKGICKLDGNTLTIAYRGLGKDRPADFASKAGSGVFVEVLKRAKQPRRSCASDTGAARLQSPGALSL